MILGIGIDTISVNRIEGLILKFGEKFQEKIFTDNEINKASLKSTPLQQILFYAKRFAAKEAFSKALGLGIGRGVDFKDIEIDNDSFGKPFIKILNQKDQFIKKHFNVNNFTIHLSLSDTKDSALAMVTISSDK
ncbi:MAG: holo-ACP synthase [Pelagibacterales bacterium]|nr:holo-ACP synthase [Pelagibacterales bacterium]